MVADEAGTKLKWSPG
uniref:Uncharacterized protein n=1 Tax=Anguilla anguilla TaxID=7936 RepID=A0A0E9SI15_ANGAN